MESLFGTQLGTTAKFAIALFLVLALIGITALILRRFSGGMPTSGGGRNRQPRLAVLDSAVVDAKRRLVLVRRDNAEHLILIGGPTDVVVETSINRAGAPSLQRSRLSQQPELEQPESPLVPEPEDEEPAQPAVRAPASRGREATPRAPKPVLDEAEELEVPLPRAPQPAAYSPPPPLPPRPVAHPSAAAPQPRAPQPEPQAQPRPVPVEPTPAPRPVQIEPQLDMLAAPAAAPVPQPRLEDPYAEMAQKLEAALRKPATPPAPKAPEPRAAAPAPQPRPAAPAMPQTRPMPAAPAPAAAQPAAPAPNRQPAPNPFDDLEAEMASLLGQDKKR